MTGRRHAQPDQQQQQQQQYDRAQISSHGLACPFAKSDPDAYMGIGACRATEGFKTLRELNEHVWRKHTPFFRCGFCPSRWSISTARGKVTQQKEEHWETCEGKRRGLRYFERFDEDGTELLDGEQQERFAKVKSIRGNDRKLEALYQACDKPVPDTYYTPVALPAVQPQVTYRTVTRTTTTRRVQQPDNQHGEFLAGFVQPRPEGHPRQPRRRTTADNVSRANAQAAGGGSYEVSGANRQPDNDSGYGSMPRNDADANDVSPAVSGFPPSHHHPGGTTYYWGHGSHASSYETSGGHVAAAATSGHDSGNPAPLNDHLYCGCLDCSAIDPLLYGGASSSNGRDGGSQVLLGLALPGPGGYSAEDHVNMWAFTNFDAELAE